MLRARCRHPSGILPAFAEEEIDQSITDRFERQAHLYPQRVALGDGTRKVTYEQLDQAANRIAQEVLSLRGEGQEQIAVLSHQSIPAVAAMLGILKSGKTYVPLDALAPVGRNRHILHDAQASLLIAEDRHASIADEIARGLCPAISPDCFAGRSTPRPGLKVSPGQSAYIMYTSGSTGEPKGVLHTHRNVLHKCRGWIQLVNICPLDRLSQLRSLSVSGSIRDVFGGLLGGAGVFMFDVKRNGIGQLSSWLQREQITVYNSVASLLRSFSTDSAGDERFSAVRLVKLSGELVYKSDVEVYRNRFPDTCLLLNMLASAEVGSTRAYFVSKESRFDADIVPVGYALEDCDVMLLNDEGQACRGGEVGEIAIRSEFLSPGYWRRPELSAAAFSDDSGGAVGRIFRTGDLGEMRADGCLLHRGRKGSHVKIRGYSVELAEVEATLLGLDDITNAVVVARPRADGIEALVAYVVPAGRNALTGSTLRRRLSATLPDYMIPAAFVLLDKLPLIGPGKVDLRALPDPGLERPALDTAFILPRDAAEQAIADIWRDVLSMDQVGIHDNFFELGGDSLQAGRVVARIAECFHVDVPLRALYGSPTVECLARIIVQARDHSLSPSSP